MKTSIETINGKLCTVIKKPFNAEWVKGQLAMGIPVVVEYNDFKRGYLTCDYNDGEMAVLPQGSTTCVIVYTKMITDILTILPALPRNPKFKDVESLLYRYMAEGLSVRGEVYIWNEDLSEIEEIRENNCALEYLVEKITHAVDKEGNRVEVAIVDNEEESKGTIKPKLSDLLEYKFDESKYLKINSKVTRSKDNGELMEDKKGQ